MGGSGDWTRALHTWLEPFLARLGHPARRRMCPLYVAGLMGPGERKSLQPIAARLAPADYDQLHHFMPSDPGMTDRSKPNCWPRLIGWSVGQTPSWSSMTPPCPRRASSRSGWPLSTPRRWARPQTLMFGVNDAERSCPVPA